MKIVFTASPKFISKLIRKLTGSEWSHVGILYGPFIIHSYVWGFDIDSSASFLAKAGNSVVLSSDKTCDVDVLLAKYNYRHYDYVGLLYLAAHFLTKKLVGVGLPAGRFLERSNAMLCMELVSSALGMQTEEALSPGELYNKLLAEGWKIQ